MGKTASAVITKCSGTTPTSTTSYITGSATMNLTQIASLRTTSSGSLRAIQVTPALTSETGWLTTLSSLVLTSTHLAMTSKQIDHGCHRMSSLQCLRTGRSASLTSEVTLKK